MDNKVQDIYNVDAKVTRIEKKLDRILLQQKVVLNMDELIEYTGFSRNHIYALCSANEIPFYKLRGKTLWFDRAEIDQWLLDERHPSKAQIEEEAIERIYSKRGGRA